MTTLAQNCESVIIAPLMAFWKQHARWLYVLALFQLLGGPLVLCGVVLFSKMGSEESVTLDQRLALTLERLVPLQSGELLFDEQLPESSPLKGPSSKPAKDTKAKFWAVEMGLMAKFTFPEPERLRHSRWHDPAPPHRGHAPPIPPPREV